MINLKLNGKGMLFGILGSLAGAIPNIILKTLLVFSGFGQACINLFYFEIGFEFGITPCGILSNVAIGSFWETFFPIILGGALFGLIGMRMGYRNAQKRGYDLGLENWEDSFRWSFGGGVLFDLIFIFMYWWPGQ